VFARIHPKRLIRQNPSDVARRGKAHPEATMTQAASKYAAAFVAKFNGRVLKPGDAEYDASRARWNGAIDRKPAVIARCSDADEMV
jgi:hypothetical protein